MHTHTQRKIEVHVGATPNACRIGGSLLTPLKEPIRAVQKTQVFEETEGEREEGERERGRE